MTTEKSIESMQAGGNFREAAVLTCALEAVRSGRDAGISVELDPRVKINGVVFWVWELGDELVEAYITALRATTQQHINKVLEVRASVPTVGLAARRT